MPPQGFPVPPPLERYAGKAPWWPILRPVAAVFRLADFDLMLVRAAKMWPKGAPLPKFVPMTITLPIRRDNHGKKGRDDD